MKMICPSQDDLHYCSIEYTPKFDAYGNVDLSDLLVNFQKIAGQHVENLGLGDSFIQEHSFYYVLCRIKGYFLSSLKPNEKYTFVTYPTKASTLQLYRYAYLLDSHGNPVFYLISLWVLINRETRRLQSARQFEEKLKEVLPDIEEVKPLTDEKLYEMDFSEMEFHDEENYVVESKDIDNNKHMNNTVYMRLAQKDCILRCISTFEIDFEKECYLGDVITLEKAMSTTGYYVIGKKSDGMLSFMTKFESPEKF